MTAEPTAQEAITGTFETVAGWREATRKAFRPQQNSELWVDDQDWPWFPTSTVAWTGLISAVDNLDAIKRHVETQVLFSVAHLASCRAALVGAAQAVWVLAPRDGQTRTKRSRTATAYMYSKHLQYLKGLQEWAAKPHIGTDTVAETIAQRARDLGDKRAADDQRNDLDTTRMIEDAAKEAFGDPKLTQEAILYWRSTSGAAHGFAWPLFGTAGTVQTKLAGEDGIAEFQAGGSLERMANPYMAAFHIARQGWSLLNRRGSTPATEFSEASLSFGPGVLMRDE